MVDILEKQDFCKDFIHPPKIFTEPAPCLCCVRPSCPVPGKRADDLNKELPVRCDTCCDEDHIKDREAAPWEGACRSGPERGLDLCQERLGVCIREMRVKGRPL